MVELILSYVEFRFIFLFNVFVEFIDLFKDCREVFEDFLDFVEERFFWREGVVDIGNLDVEERGEGVFLDLFFFYSLVILFFICFFGLLVILIFFFDGVKFFFVFFLDFFFCNEEEEVFFFIGVEGFELLRRLALLFDFFRFGLLL